MAEPETEHEVTRKVVYEHASSTSSRSGITAWVIIAILAIALIAYIAVQLT